jgi:salicylate synthetase
MVAELNTVIKYHETFLPVKREPIAVLHNFLQSGIFSNYVLYEGRNEIRIAGNELVKVSVSQDSVSLNGIGKFYSESVSDPLKQVEELLNSLPIENWTAYGYVAFDIARFYSSYSQAIQQASLYFLIPETELRFTEEGIYIRSTKSLERIRNVVELDNQIPNYVPAPLAVDCSDREIYQNRIKALIEAIQSSKLHKAIIASI